jgi:hypothetical protein
MIPHAGFTTIGRIDLTYRVPKPSDRLADDLFRAAAPEPPDGGLLDEVLSRFCAGSSPLIAIAGLC